MLTVEEYLDSISQKNEWWHRVARDCIEKGWYQDIRSRNDNSLYLMRFWLSPPTATRRGGAIPDSADNLLLHNILKPDDQPALHNHPWEFHTKVISGGYIEYACVKGGPVTQAHWSVHGEEWGEDRHFCGFNDFHRIDSVEPDTWSLVRTGDREKPWGFLVNGKVVPQEEYLNKC